MQKPTLWYTEYERTQYVFVYNHTTGIYHYLSLSRFEVSYVPKGQKQAFSKRL